MFSSQSPQNGGERCPRLTLFAIEARQVRLLQVLASTELMSARVPELLGNDCELQAAVASRSSWRGCISDMPLQEAAERPQSTAGRQRSN